MRIFLRIHISSFFKNYIFYYCTYKLTKYKLKQVSMVILNTSPQTPRVISGRKPSDTFLHICYRKEQDFMLDVVVGPNSTCKWRCLHFGSNEISLTCLLSHPTSQFKSDHEAQQQYVWQISHCARNVFVVSKRVSPAKVLFSIWTDFFLARPKFDVIFNDYFRERSVCDFLFTVWNLRIVHVFLLFLCDRNR